MTTMITNPKEPNQTMERWCQRQVNPVECRVHNVWVKPIARPSVNHTCMHVHTHTSPVLTHNIGLDPGSMDQTSFTALFFSYSPSTLTFASTEHTQTLSTGLQKPASPEAQTMLRTDACPMPDCEEYRQYPQIVPLIICFNCWLVLKVSGSRT